MYNNHKVNRIYARSHSIIDYTGHGPNRCHKLSSRASRRDDEQKGDFIIRDFRNLRPGTNSSVVVLLESTVRCASEESRFYYYFGYSYNPGLSTNGPYKKIP